MATNALTKVLFGEDPSLSSKASIERQRRIADMLANSQYTPNSGALGSAAMIAQAIASRRQASSADQSEAARNKALGEILTGSKNPADLESASVSMGAPELMQVAGNRRDQANADRSFGFQQDRAKVGDQQWQQGFGLQKDQFGFQQNRANVADSQWQQQFGANQSNADREYALKQQELAGTAPKLVEIYDPQTGQPYKARYNPSTGGFEREGGIKAPNGTQLQVGADGSVMFTQGMGKALTESQSKDTVYATRAEGALPTLDKYGQILTSLPQSVGGGAPVVGNYMKSDDFQRAEQAGNEFLQAILRKDTGATITPQEKGEYGVTYLPQPGDGAPVLEQKRIARQRALDAMKAGMPPQAILAQEQALKKQQPISGAPQVGTVDGGYRFKGGDPSDRNSWEPVR